VSNDHVVDSLTGMVELYNKDVNGYTLHAMDAKAPIV